METIIEFVGLCVITTQLLTGGNLARLELNHTAPQQRVVFAVLPWVTGNVRKTGTVPVTTLAPANEKSSRMSTLHTDPNLNSTLQVANVEPHTAMIAFDPQALVSVKGWKPAALGNDGWFYIELSGEHLTFVPDLANDAVTPPETLLLPHLGKTHALTTPYTYPNYAGAAAVFEIPTGTLNACVGSGTTSGRIDTTLTLQTSDTLTITSTTEKKSITLKAGYPVIIANVPLSYAMTHNPAGHAHNHFQVYCAMTGQAPCSWPPPATTSTIPTKPLTTCDNPHFRPAAGHQTPPPPPPLAMNDFACSNTQWP